jgi:hypothetical protein
MTTTTTVAPAVAVAPTTYAEIVNSAQKLKLEGICDIKTFNKLPEALQPVIMAELVKRVTERKKEALGQTLTAINELIQQTAPDILTQIRSLMAEHDITAVNVRITAETFGIVKQLDKPTATRSVGTGTKSSKYTYYINDNMITGGSSAVATALGIDTETEQYKKANGWLKIAVQAKAQGATVTRTNADNDTVEQFAPEATTKEAHAVWFTKQ